MRSKRRAQKAGEEARLAAENERKTGPGNEGGADAEPADAGVAPDAQGVSADSSPLDPDLAAAEAAALESDERLSELETKLAAELAAWREREASLLRQLADRENQIRRLERAREQELEIRRGEILAPLIAILDDFDRALEHKPAAEEQGFAEGVAQIAARLRETLTKLGLKPIEALGRKFDPNLHEAVMQVESEDVAKGHVALEMQKGYLLGERVLRPSKVAVSR